MNKINYPLTATDKAILEDEFYKVLSKNEEPLINKHLSKITFKGASLSFRRLVTLPFDDLISLEPQIKKYSDGLIKIDKKKKTTSNKFADLFQYKKNQPRLANFFMTQKCFKLQSCSYCSIDYINSFVDFPDYKSDIEFVNKANVYELQYIKDLTEPMAIAIIASRGKKGYSSLNSIPAPAKIKKVIKEIPFANSHNHFTLDHLIPQNSHRFYSLCLYNLVPSCYACNSKFKNDVEFDIDANLIYVSPTSDSYSLINDIEFQILFSSTLDKIKSEKDFLLAKKISTNDKHIEKHLRMFKILGRYVYHKDQILKLIEKKIKYPASKIKELSKKTGVSQKELNKLLFGEDLFSHEFDGRPLVKFRRDIAKNIKIKDVL